MRLVLFQTAAEVEAPPLDVARKAEGTEETDDISDNKDG